MSKCSWIRSAAVLGFMLSALACGDGDGNGGPEPAPADGGHNGHDNGDGGVVVPPIEWDCDSEHDQWERCDEGEIIWCHAVGTPHYHSGAKCASAQLDCSELEPGRAICTDDSLTCVDGAFDCDGNTARNCFGGIMGLTPCGTRRVCLADDAAQVATCWDDRPEAVCSGHGSLFEDGCVCFRGYARGPDDTCVPAP